MSGLCGQGVVEVTAQTPPWVVAPATSYCFPWPEKTEIPGHMEPLALDQAWNLTEQFHPELQVVRLEIAQKQEEWEAVKAAFWPTLDITAYWERVNVPSTPSSSVSNLNDEGWNAVANWTLQWNLYSGGHDTAQSQKADWAWQEQRWSYQDQRNQLFIQLIENYGQLLLRWQQIRQNILQQSLQKLRIERADLRLEQGETTQQEMNLLKNELLTQEIQMHELQLQLLELSQRLGQLMGRPLNTVALFLPWEDTLPQIPVYSRVPWNSVLRHHPRYQVLHRQIQQTQAEVDRLEAPFRPNVNFSATEEWEGEHRENPTRSVENLQAARLRLRLTVTQSLFAGGKDRANRRAAQIAVEKAQLQASLAFQQLLQEAQQAEKLAGVQTQVLKNKQKLLLQLGENRRLTESLIEGGYADRDQLELVQSRWLVTRTEVYEADLQKRLQQWKVLAFQQGREFEPHIAYALKNRTTRTWHTCSDTESSNR